eukprot:1157009-Pelagomonas_calceolata.AAC.11
MEYEEPATGYDEYEAMVESQQPLELPGSQAAEEQQKQLRHATQLPMTKEVQQLAYTRMPHRTRAAAGMLRAAFKELQPAGDTCTYRPACQQGGQLATFQTCMLQGIPWGIKGNLDSEEGACLIKCSPHLFSKPNPAALKPSAVLKISNTRKEPPIFAHATCTLNDAGWLNSFNKLSHNKFSKGQWEASGIIMACALTFLSWGPQGPEEEEVELDLRTLVAGRSRLSAARWFTDVIALQNANCVAYTLRSQGNKAAIEFHPQQGSLAAQIALLIQANRNDFR